jgi:hypothetical protein
LSEAIRAIEDAISLGMYDVIEEPSFFEFIIYKSIINFDSLSIMIIDNFIENERIDYLLAVQLLSFLGQMNHPNTFHHRTILLTKSLKNKSRYIREGARLGLLYMKNPSVIPALEDAIKQETSERLKKKLIYTVEKIRDLG